MKKKNLLNSLTRLTLALVFMVSLSLSSFAQTSGGFNYQAAIDPSYTTVTVEWTIGTYSGTVSDVAVTNGILSTIVGQNVNYVTLVNPELEIVIKDSGDNIIATSSQVIKAVPYADYAKNVYVNSDGNIVINGTTFTGYSTDPTFNSLRATTYIGILGLGNAVNNDTYSETNAALRVAGGMFVGGITYFDQKVFINQLMDVGSFSINSGQEVTGIYNVYPYPYAGPEFALPTYAALNMFLDSIGVSLDLDKYLLKVDAAATYETISNVYMLRTQVEDNTSRIEVLEAYDSLGLQHAYDMGNEVKLNEVGIVLTDYGLNDGNPGLISTISHTLTNSAAVVGNYNNYGGELGSVNSLLTSAVLGHYSDIFGALAAEVDSKLWAGYFNGDVNINGDLYVTNTLFVPHVVTDLIDANTINTTDLTVENLSITGDINANNGIFKYIFALDADLNKIESHQIEANHGMFNQVTIGQYHGSPLAFNANSYLLEVFKPIYFYDSAIFLGPVVFDYPVTIEDLTVNLLTADTINADYADINELVVATIEGDNAEFNDLHAINAEFDNIELSDLSLTDTMFVEEQFKVLDVNFVNATVTPNLSYKSILGGSSANTFGSGFDRADGAVLGYPTTFFSEKVGLGVLGARIFNVTDVAILEAYSLAAGDDKVFAGFFVGDVAVTGKLGVNQIVSISTADAAEYKTVDIDFTDLATSGFTGILGGTVPSGSLYTSASAAVVGYNKALSPAQIGSLGSKVYGITDNDILAVYGLAAGDDKEFAGFFVGDVYVEGNLAASQAKFLNTNTADAKYKLVDANYVSMSGNEFKAILGASSPAGAYTTEFTQGDAAFLGYDKLNVAAADGGVAALGAHVYNVDPAGKIFEVFGPAGWNTLIAGNTEKIFAGFFVGDVLIKGNLAIQGDVKIDGSLKTSGGVIYGEIISAADYADLCAQATPCSAKYPQGSVIVVLMAGQIEMYVALTIAGIDKWMKVQ